MRCSRGRLITSLVLGSLDEFAAVEADEGEQVGCVNHPAQLLDGFDELDPLATPAARGPGPE